MFFFLFFWGEGVSPLFFFFYILVFSTLICFSNISSKELICFCFLKFSFLRVIERWWNSSTAGSACFVFVIWLLSSFSVGCSYLLSLVFFLFFVCLEFQIIRFVISTCQYSSSKFPSFYSPHTQSSLIKFNGDGFNKIQDFSFPFNDYTGRECSGVWGLAF